MRLFKFKIYRKMLITYLLFLSLTIILVSGVLFSLFHAAFTKDAQNYSASLLKEKGEEISYLSSQALSCAIQLLSYREVASFVSSTDQEFYLNEYRLSLLAKKIHSSYPFNAFVEIYNTDTGRYYNTLGADGETIRQIKESTAGILDKGVNSVGYFARRAANGTEVLSFYSNEYAAKSTFAVISIDQAYILKRLGNTAKQTTGRTFVVDGTGIILSHPEEELIGKSCNTVLDMNQFGFIGENAFVQTMNAVKSKITAQKCAGIDWYVVNDIAYEGAIRNSIDTLYGILAVSLAAIAVVCVLIVSASSRIYKPMRGLIGGIDSTADGVIDEAQVIGKEIGALKDSGDKANDIIHKTRTAVDRHIMQSLLEGKNLEKARDMLRVSENLGYLLDEDNFYTVYTFQIDDFTAIEPLYFSGDIELLKYGISNIIREVMGESFPCECISAGADTICAVAVQKTEAPDGIRLLLARINGHISEYAGFYCSIFIGDTVARLEDVSLSCRCAQEYGKAQFIEGFGCVIDRAVYESCRSSGEVTDSGFAAEFIDLLYEEGNKEKLVRRIQGFMEELSAAGCGNARKLLSRFADMLGESLLLKSGVLGILADDARVICENIENAKTLSIVQEQLVELVSTIQPAVTNRKSATLDKRHDVLVKAVAQIVEKEYANPNLSIGEIAERVNISSGYLGKVFKERMQISFVNYLTGVRLEQARKMLVSTDTPAFAIGNQVGIVSPAYFTTLFKNKYGYTPSQYREFYICNLE